MLSRILNQTATMPINQFARRIRIDPAAVFIDADYLKPLDAL
ncbi:hypothetical protein ACFB49_25480 [Sphingomonas sp. DBB INV C78]